MCVQNLMRDGKDDDSGASLELPQPQNYSALDIWAYESAEELKVRLRSLSSSCCAVTVMPDMGMELMTGFPSGTGD